MNQYSVILLDIDGTLLNSRNEISPNTKKLLRRLETKGVPIVLTSDRAPSEADAVARQAGIRAPVVCYGGGLILDENRSILADIGIPPSVALPFKAFVNGEFPEISFYSYLYDVWLSDNPEDEETRRLTQINKREPLRGELAFAMRNARHAHKFLCAGSPRGVQKLLEAAGREFPTLNFSLSGPGYLEAAPKGVSKRAAMETIRRRYDIDATRIVAIGNDCADMEMLREAGVGIAMGNAPKAVRNAADRVTASNDDEGVYIALKGLRFQPPGNPDAASSADA